MNTSQLRCCIRCDSTLRGRVEVYAADMLPGRLNNFPAGLIVNTDTHDKSGKHWIALYFRDEVNAEFFDSYGHSVDYYNSYFDYYLHKHAENVTVNEKRIQGDATDVCGLYCLFYLRKRLNNVAMRDILKPFSKTNFMLNDSFVYNYMKHTYPYCFRDKRMYNQICIPLCK